MKTRSAKRIYGRFGLVTLTLAIVLMIFGGNSAYAQNAVVATDDSSGIQVQTLWAGQDIYAGTVSTEVVGEELVITYSTDNGFELTEAHLWVGGDLANMPQTKKGNPKIGNFPYNSGDISGATYYSFNVPLANLGFSCPTDDQDYFIAAHAALVRSDGSGGYDNETGWADGDRFAERGAWGTFFTITLTCDTVEPPLQAACETAFAYGDSYANDFLQMDLDNDGVGDFNRWGWSNGPLGAGSYTFDIYAGAGRSDITKGTLVGSLTVDYDGSSATVTFNPSGTNPTTGINYYMNEIHLYVGNEILAKNVNDEFTVAPGQYPLVVDNLVDQYSYTTTVTGLSGQIYVVAHAVACGFPQ